jgi:hypothetical protein
LADAGIATTNAFSQDYQTTAAHLRQVEMSDAFTNTLEYCKNPKLTCQPQLASDASHQAREDLARAVDLRGNAVNALSGAYAALKAEAAYDAKGDMVTATNGAIDAVNHFSGSVLAIGGAAAAPTASLISAPLKNVIGFGAGMFADRAQARRLKAASHVIAAVTRRLRDSLSVEEFVFDSLADHIEQARESAKESLLTNGLVSNDSVITPMINDLGLTPAPGLDSTIRGSPARQAAVTAVLEAQSKADVENDRARYAASIKALNQLLDAHAAFERGDPLSLTELDTLVAELNAEAKPGK